MVFQNILVPVDADGVANDALDEALALAKVSNGHVTALHVVKAGADAPPFLKETLNKAESAGIRAELKLMTGMPGETILSESKNYDLIVMGTAKKKKILANSVAKEVIRAARCPVIVVRAKG